MGSTPLRATAVGGGAARPAARRRVDRGGRRAGGRGHRAARRPERDARLQAPPGARAHAPGARGGRGRPEPSTAPQPYDEALAGERYLADRGLSTAVFLAPTLEQPLLLEGEAGVGKTEVAKALAGATGRAPDPAPVPRGHRPPPRPLRLGLPAPAAAPARRGRGRASRSTPSEFLLRRPLLEALEASEPVVLLIDEIDRADDEFEAFLLEFLSDFQVSIPELGTITRRAPAARGRSPRTARASCTTRSSAAASTTGSTTRRPSARPRSCARACPACRTRSPSASARRSRGCAARSSTSCPGVGETIAWAQALLALDDADLERHARRGAEGARGHRPRARAAGCCDGV